ncbi:MAG: hypothetical protein EZS28_042174 [Streblomastix strix]|uniref:Uncharacterized protein n=1 Tax=Streblomastix strix TaxID=222440 RepID=A0A5J4TWP1_9EUKA|nr:MAG: hypothetical protein EZS28_042174 [Streblomastix strix]
MILQGSLAKGIIDTTNISPSQTQNDFKQFIETRAYSDPNNASITPMMHYLCDAFVRTIFDDSSMPSACQIAASQIVLKIACQLMFNYSREQMMVSFIGFI